MALEIKFLEKRPFQIVLILEAKKLNFTRSEIKNYVSVGLSKKVDFVGAKSRFYQPQKTMKSRSLKPKSR